jgi:hypothetical protein
MLRHRSVREVRDNPSFVIWSFKVRKDLRARDQLVDMEEE